MDNSSGGESLSGENTDGTSQYIVLQALADLALDTSVVLEDEASRSLLSEGYNAATTAQDREALEGQFNAASKPAESTAENTAIVEKVVDAVLAELAGRDVSATLIHEVGTRLEEREVGLFNFARTKAVTALENLSLSPMVQESIFSGAELVSRKQYRQAISHFEAALDCAQTIDDEITPRVLAAWTHHWNGNDGNALDYVDEALHLQYGAWAPRLIGAVADHTSPELFRSGHLSVQAYLRGMASVPEESRLTAAVGYPEGGRPKWEPLSEDLDCMKLPSLSSKIWIRLQLSGLIGSMPSLQGYYLAVGIVDEENNVPRSVIHQIMTGPSGMEPQETITFRGS